MGKIESRIKHEIHRLSKKEVRAAFLPLKREVRQITVKLSALSKGVSSMNRLTKDLRLKGATPKLEATPEEVKVSRLTPERIRGLRKKLGISQRELGILTGASLGAVLSWEKGKFKPKADKKAALVGLRKLGKREVKKMLTAELGKPKESRPEGRGKRKAGAKKKATRTRKPTAKRGKWVARK